MNDDPHLLSSYRFDLPDELIATRPLPERRASRLLILPHEAIAPRHGQFTEVLDLLDPGDVLVVNDTTVLPARLFARKAESGGAVEVLLSRPNPDGSWVALVKSSKKPKPGTRLVFGQDAHQFADTFFATIETKLEDEPGAYQVRFEGDVVAYAQAYGQLPLPPYMARDAEAADRDRYQTVYANPQNAGAAAAPTAGLHFDTALLAELEDRGIQIARVTLHVGPGTFLPVRVDDVRQHQMHAEPWSISEDTAERLNAARARGSRIIAVGTTSVRTLEGSLAEAPPDAPFTAGSGLTRIFIRPGYRFRAIDALITNFHLPESTLLMLVSAVAGRERVLAAYDEAIRARYRFYSYGDACYFEVLPEARA